LRANNSLGPARYYPIRVEWTLYLTGVGTRSGPALKEILIIKKKKKIIKKNKIKKNKIKKSAFIFCCFPLFHIFVFLL